ncbi:hypothetical protein GGS26DRAFT_172469 [Hypomontagnella submonticulosa]|nr:hypothetical protein GGS26DRAFT_172469 [Hypomontagnella submonticulosa]
MGIGPAAQNACLLAMTLFCSPSFVIPRLTCDGDDAGGYSVSTLVNYLGLTYVIQIPNRGILGRTRGLAILSFGLMIVVAVWGT